MPRGQLLLTPPLLSSGAGGDRECGDMLSGLCRVSLEQRAGLARRRAQRGCSVVQQCDAAWVWVLPRDADGLLVHHGGCVG